MPQPAPAPVILEFDPALHPESDASYLNISAVVQDADELWLGSDELTSVERLTRTAADRFAQHTTFALGDYLDLPAGHREEVDIEGLSIDGGYLWLTGSHSLKRESPDGAGGRRAAIKRLERMVRETNRFLLARIPLIRDPRTGVASLHKTFVDPRAGRQFRAAQISGSAEGNLLSDALRSDPHLGRFLEIPSKENGFDVEGLAVHGDRVFLGLRGPVLAGWAVILELEVELRSDGRLGLRPIGPGGALYRKHFVDLHGLGVRELCRDGKDLLILAGPSMDLDGHVRVVCWRGAFKVSKEKIVRSKRLETILEFRFRSRAKPGKDHPEGITLYDDGRGERRLLVTYDNPGRRKRPGRGRIAADAFRLAR